MNVSTDNTDVVQHNDDSTNATASVISDLSDRERVEAAFEELKSRGIFAALLETGGCACWNCSLGRALREQGAEYYGVTSDEFEQQDLRYVVIKNELDWFDDSGLNYSSYFNDLHDSAYLGDYSLRRDLPVHHRGDVFNAAKTAFATVGLTLTWDGNSRQTFIVKA